MSVLVTGGAGFIGSHTCVELLNAGEEIVLLDNLSNATPDIPEKIKRITGRDFPVCVADVCDEEALAGLFAAHGIEAVIHFAGLKAVGESVRLPLEYYRNNVAGTVSLLRAMRHAGCGILVFSSSATVYGDENEVPFVETQPVKAVNPYGETKIMIERILTDLCAADPDCSAVMLRYFNPLGAHKSGLLGDNPRGIPNNLLPYILKVAMGELPHLSIWGDDYPTPDGTGVRDYLHVTDLAEGHVRALRYAKKHKGAIPINLGTGRGHSVLEVMRAFEEASGVKIKYEVGPRRSGDIAEMRADPSRALRLLGWKATRSLGEMCGDAWNFINSL